MYALAANSKSTAVLVGLLWFLGAGDSDARALDNYMELDLEQLLEIKITGATLSDESLASVPAAVTVFNRSQLDSLGVDYLFELLNFVPGYQFNRNADSPAGYTFSARGRRNSAEAREVLLLVDGRVFADPRTGGADGSLPLFPLAQVERVEVIRGPGSALYGSNAMTGVINIITRKQENRLAVALGSQNRALADVLLTHNLNDWALNLFARAYTDQGQHYSFSPDSGLADTQDPIRSEALDMSIQHGTSQLRLAYHSVDTRDFFVAEGLDNDINEYLQLFRNLDFQQSWQATAELSTHWRFAYTDIRQEFAFVALPATALAAISEPASNDPLIINGVFAGETYQLANNNSWNLGSDTRLQFGFDWHQQWETHAYAHNNFDLGQLAQGDFPINYYGDLTHTTPVGRAAAQRALGLYSQYLHQVNARARLNLGLRYDHYEGIGAHLSPRLGWVQQLNEQQTLKLLYGEAYRAPSLSEMGLINNPVLLGNSALEYEIVNTWDLIWMHNSQNLSLVVYWFHNRYESPISTGFLGTTRTYINGADESSQGVELELSRQLNQQWRLSASYTHFIDLPETAFREARQLGALILNYNQARWNINLAGGYVGARYAVKTDTLNPVMDNQWQLQSKVRYYLNNQLELVFQVKNVLDAQIQTPAQGNSLRIGVPSRGREWSLGISMQL